MLITYISFIFHLIYPLIHLIFFMILIQIIMFSFNNHLTILKELNIIFMHLYYHILVMHKIHLLLFFFSFFLQNNYLILFFIYIIFTYFTLFKTCFCIFCINVFYTIIFTLMKLCKCSYFQYF